MPRLQHAMERRDRHPESWWWATEEGRHWLTRLVVATLSTFGLKRGVGMDTSSEFFARWRLDTHVGCAPSALRGVMQRWEAAVRETAQTWERDGITHGEVRAIIGAVDETCLEHLLLVFQDVSTGYLLLDTVAADRTSATWKAAVDQRLAEWGTRVWSVVSDRAKALMQLAAQGLECLSMQGLECLSMPDVFPCVHEIVQSSALAMGRRLRHARQDLQHAEEVLARHVARGHTVPHSPEAQAPVEAQRAEVQHGEDVQRLYRHHLATRSLTRHPFDLVDSVPQTSAQVAHQLQTGVEAIEA